MQDFDLRPEFTQKPKSKWKFAPLFVALFIFLVYGVLRVLPPKNFPTGTIIKIAPGETVVEVADNAKRLHLVNSASILKIFMALSEHGQGAIAGDYYFDEPLSAPTVAKRLVTGIFGLRATKITIPEGSTNVQISAILEKELPYFDKKEFLKLTQKNEGYLFPDTYLVSPMATTSEIIKLLENNFDEQISSLQGAILKFGKPLNDVITMASILEAEARQTDTRKIVAGILWKRLSLGMPLQIDASLRYVTGKASADLTLDDLALKSPYNTYLHAGLTPSPISNPGIDAIKAAITPTKSGYLYFLTDGEGVMHYAKTFEEHVANKAKYLR